MSKKTERKFILSMLEAGTINTHQAQELLQALQPGKRSRRRTASNTIVVEMDADKDNVRSVLEKLNKAILGKQQLSAR